MKLKVVLTALLTSLIIGCSTDNETTEDVTNTVADGIVTEEEAEMMQEEWCKYNEGKDFAAEQCEEYWEESSE